VNFFDVFGKEKIIFAMLHLKGENSEIVLERTKREIDIYLSNKINALIVENYFGSENDVEQVLKYLNEKLPDIMYGVNMLDNDQRGFEAAAKFNAKFIQLDSVAGHLTPDDDIVFADKMKQWRSLTPAVVLGGVRFKYQPYKSGRTLEEDLKIAMNRCDAIVVTGTGTGVETEMSKIKEFRSIIGDFPLIVGAGVTPDNCKECLNITNGAIIGSYFKDNCKDDGEVDDSHVKKLKNAITNIAKEEI